MYFKNDLQVNNTDIQPQKLFFTKAKIKTQKSRNKSIIKT